MLLVPFFVALLPLAAAVVGGDLAPDIPVPNLDSAERVLLGAEEDDTKRALLDRIAAAADPYSDYRGQIAALGASILLAAFIAMAIRAQRQLIQRHWSFFMADKGVPTANAPTQATIGAGICIVSLTLWLTPMLELPGPLESALNRDVILSIALLAAAAMTLGFVTLLGSFIVSGNFPTLAESQNIARGFTRAKWHYEVKSNREVVEVAFPEPHDFKYVAPEIGATQNIGVLDQTSLTIDPGLTARQSIDLINSMCFVLAAAFVFTLTVLSFSSGALADQAGGPAEFEAALKAAMDGWVIFVGLGASATLAVAYIVPVLRVMPFLYAAEAIEEQKKKEAKPPKPPAKRPWSVKGSLGLKGVDVIVDRLPADETNEEKPYDVFEHHLYDIGVTEERLDSIVGSEHLGGAFHTFTKDTLTKHLTSVLTIIAPAAAGTILSLLG